MLHWLCGLCRASCTVLGLYSLFSIQTAAALLPAVADSNFFILLHVLIIKVHACISQLTESGLDGNSNFFSAMILIYMSTVFASAVQLSSNCSQGGLVLCKFSTCKAIRSHCEYLAPQSLPALFHLFNLLVSYNNQGSWRDIGSLCSSVGGECMCSPSVVVLQILEDSL